jgi:TIGR03009 family protein
MMIARFGMAAACVVAVALSGSAAVAQVGATAPQTPYQQYQSRPIPSQPYPPPQSQPPQDPQPNPQGPAQRPQQQYTEPQPPPPPFVLTPQQQAELDQALAKWEHQSGLVTKFRCNFTKYTYDPTFLPPTLGADGKFTEEWIKMSTGEIKYRAPDEGLIEDDDVKEVTNPGTPGQKVVDKKFGEHWACDGNVLSAVDHEKKEVHRTKLPPEMQGKFISEGPLPFAFGTKAAPLKKRYYLRLITPPDKQKDQVWLDIRPRFQKDLANFIEVDVVLRAADMLPSAIQITHAEVKVPVLTSQGEKIVVGRQREVYVFEEKSWGIPNILYDDFLPHPLGYRIIDEQTPGEQGAPPANNPQARRQWPPKDPVKLQ